MNILISQPYLTNYRVDVFKELSQKHDVTVVASTKESFGLSDSEKFGFNFEKINEKSFWGGNIFWQSGVLRVLIKNKPDVYVTFANPRYLSFWASIIICCFLKCKVFLHGQGLYKKNNISLIDKFFYYIMSIFSNAYICYTESCKRSLIGLPIYKKAFVAENSLVNKKIISKKNGNCNGILFVGRIREGCNIELLINAILSIKKEYFFDLDLHIVGGGSHLAFLKKKYINNKNIIFYGEIYSPDEISNISEKCFVGCYPGDAGLSILHYMSLSLPAIAHSELFSHMGPEVSYIKDGVNGLFFKRFSLDSLIECILSLLNNEDLLKSMQVEAFNTYAGLVEPSLASRIEKIILKVAGYPDEALKNC